MEQEQVRKRPKLEYFASKRLVLIDEELGEFEGKLRDYCEWVGLYNFISVYFNVKEWNANNWLLEKHFTDTEHLKATEDIKFFTKSQLDLKPLQTLLECQLLPKLRSCLVCTTVVPMHLKYLVPFDYVYLYFMNSSNDVDLTWLFIDEEMTKPCLEVIGKTVGFPDDKSDMIPLLCSRKHIDLQDAIPEFVSVVAQYADSLYSLEISWTPMNHLPTSIVKWSTVTQISFVDCGLVELSEEISQLVNLKSLDVPGNELTNLPESLGCLTKLHNLDASNNHIQKLPISLAKLPLKYIKLGKNPLVRPPKGVYISAGTKNFLRTLEEYSHGEVNLRSLKLMMIGPACSGKTTLLHFLSKKYNAEEVTKKPSEADRTVGVQISNWFIQDGSDRVSVSAWDFAGQDECLHFHRIFAEQRALYFLCFSLETLEQNHKHIMFDTLCVWLQSVPHGKDATVVLVGTHGDECKQKEHTLCNAKALVQTLKQLSEGSESMPTIDKFIEAEMKDELTTDAFKSLHEAISSSPAFKTPLCMPSTFLAYKEALMSTNFGSPYIPWDSYSSWASRILDTSLLGLVTDFLHDLGIIFRVQKQLVVLKPQWIADVLAAVVYPRVIENRLKSAQDSELFETPLVSRKPSLTLKEFNLAFTSVSKATTNQPTIEQMMTLLQEFSLCFPLSSKEYLFPVLLEGAVDDLPMDLNSTKSIHRIRVDMLLGMRTATLTVFYNYICALVNNLKLTYLTGWKDSVVLRKDDHTWFFVTCVSLNVHIYIHASTEITDCTPILQQCISATHKGSIGIKYEVYCQHCLANGEIVPTITLGPSEKWKLMKAETNNSNLRVPVGCKDHLNQSSCSVQVPFEPSMYSAPRYKQNLYVFHSGGKNPLFDMIFIHGVKGSAIGTWNNQSGVLWPREWLAHVGVEKATRILAVDNPNGSLQRQAQAVLILSKLKGAKVGDRPVIFAGHSQGGVQIRELITILNNLSSDSRDEDSQEYYRRFLSNIAGVILYGTPHKGSSLAVPLAVVANFFGVGKSKGLIPQAYLKKLRKFFRKMTKVCPNLNCLSFIETAGMNRVSEIVKTYDSKLPGDVFVTPYDHFRICKPDSMQDEIYKLTEAFVRNIQTTFKRSQPAPEARTSHRLVDGLTDQEIFELSKSLNATLLTGTTACCELARRLKIPTQIINNLKHHQNQTKALIDHLCNSLPQRERSLDFLISKLKKKPPIHRAAEYLEGINKTSIPPIDS